MGVHTGERAIQRKEKKTAGGEEEDTGRKVGVDGHDLRLYSE